jgi:hypothetical protein
MQTNKSNTVHNRTRDKSQKIISIDDRKAFDKICHPFMIKAQKKLGIEGSYLNIGKTVYNKPRANITLSREKLKAFLLKSGKRQRCPVPQSNNARERNKRDVNRKEEVSNPSTTKKKKVKSSLFADNLILHLRDPKYSNKNF